MYVIEISEPKMADLSGHIEKALKYMGKAMQSVDAIMEESGYGHRDSGRGSYGNRYDNYGMRGGMGYREDDDDWDESEMMGERRRRSRRTGRYM